MTMTDDGTEFVLERVFTAPAGTLWKAWTEPELFARWYKPNPRCETEVLEYDLQPGGVMRYEMRFGEAHKHFELWQFETIEPPERLQWKQMLTDAEGQVIGHAQMPDWPKVMLTTIELEDHPEGTLQRLTWEPYEATEAELECFQGAAEKLDQGWVGAFDNLEELLADA